MEPKNNGGRSALSIFLFIAVPLAFFVALWMVLNPGTAQKTVTEKYSEYIAYFEQNQVQDYTLDLGTGALQITLRENYRKDVNGDGKIDDKDVLTYKVPDVGTFLDLVTPLVNANNRDDDPSNDITYNWKPVSQRSWIISLLPSILTGVLLIVVIISMRRSLSGLDGSRMMGFGKVKAKASIDDKRKTTFADVAGADEEKEESNVLVGHLSMDSVFTREDFDTKQHFTQPPAHYTEASLVKALEELGIGRPSTYAPTISIILGRRYVTKEAKNLYLTEIGEVVNNIMKQSFPSIVDANFTANMEGLLDMVEEGKVAWKDVIRNFYPDLDEAVKRAEIELESVKIEDEVTDVICENCGRHMVIKYGPHGRFLACPGFPECKNTKPYFEKIGVACPKCGKEIVLKKTKKGRKYYGCEDNPDCDFMSWQKPSAKKCPKCGSYMVEKGNKLLCANETCGYRMDKPAEEQK